MLILKKIFNNRGFTLLEALVGIAVISVVGYILADILVKGFKGSAKTEVIGSIKQSGQVALNNISQAVRTADSVVCTSPVGSDPQLLTLLDQSGSYKRFTIYSTGGLICPVGHNNGCILADDPLPGGSFDPQHPDYLCDLMRFHLTNQSYLTDPAAISVKHGSFTFMRDNKAKDLVKVKFQLNSVNTGGGFENQLANDVDFETTVAVR